MLGIKRSSRFEDEQAYGLFGRLSIKRKLVLMIMLVSSAAMLLAGGAFITYQWFSFRQRMVFDLSTHAKILADNLTGAIAFNDPLDAESVLKSLEARLPIVSAYVYLNDGSVFARYQRKNVSPVSPPPGPKSDSYSFTRGWLVMFKQIMLNGEPIGTLYLQSDLTELSAFLERSVIPLALLILLASIAAYALSAKLQRIISRPLFHLAKITMIVSQNEDYSVRALKSSEDEIGTLTDAFNNMLSQIEKRDMALRESEEKYRSLYDTSRDAIMIVNPLGEFISGNPSTIKLFGCKDEKDFITRTFEELSPQYQPDGRLSSLKVQEMMAAALEKGSHFFEWKLRRLDGEEFFSEVLLNRMKLQDELVLHATIRDITDRKMNEEELRRLRNLLSNIINSMPSILVGVDREGRVTHWNREAEAITGVKAGDAQGRLLAEVFPQLSGEMEKVQEAILERKPRKEEKIASKVYGETRFSDVTVYPLITNGVEGAVIRVDDVTERVHIEEMMIQSEKMLSVGGLAAGMAHEINNPLAGILQNIQVIRNRIKRGLPKNSRTAKECGTSMEAIEAYMERRGMFSMIESILESGGRASKIVDNMLSFSRKGTANFASHDLCALLDKTVELACNDYDLKKKYDFRKIKILREYDTTLPEVSCEASMIQQVFFNILKNGAHAMSECEDKKETPQFMLRVVKESNMARAEIEDNGPGLDEFTRKRIFEPFFTTKGVGSGTGLGLSVSYFIITENHGGTMTVESTPGKGTKFIIRLPLKRGTQCQVIR